MTINKSIPITWDLVPLKLKPEAISDSSFEFPDFLKTIEEAKASGFLEEKTSLQIKETRPPLIDMDAYLALYGNSSQE